MDIELISYHEKHFNDVFSLVHRTIEEIYPLYYPGEAVTFFHNHHSEENMRNEISGRNTVLAVKNGIIIGTGSVTGNEIKRFFILPEEQGKGYGKKLFAELERIISDSGFPEAELDASLCSYDFYRKHNYQEAEYRTHPLPEGGKLCYFHMKRALNAPLFSSIDYNGRVFRSSSNSETGEVNESTLFYYRQEGSIVWAEYSGGSIARGFLIGKSDSKGALSFSYGHVNTSGEIRTGRCVSNPVFLPDGKVQMNEKWKWTNGDGSEGESVITEVING